MGSETIDTVVTTAEGAARGKRLGNAVTWRGIPYAAPPVGPLRLRRPQPVTPWADMRDATRWGHASPQGGTGRTPLGPVRHQEVSEDCLTLNVLAPSTTSGTPRPVMVFVHGGAYVLGTSSTPMYSGRTLVNRGDIVYVSFNYRLGALGYLDLTAFSTPERPFDSNLGLRDQVAALEWVQRNIAAFGGDPDNVTVFGESAGGNAVTTLMATPAAKGLFHKAIAESSAPGLVADSHRTAQWGADFVEILGYSPDDAADALEAADVDDLGKAGHKLAIKTGRTTPGQHPFGPVVDGDYLPVAPIDAFRNGSAHRVPMIIGTNAREGTLFPKALDILPTNPRRIERLFAATDPDALQRVTSAYPDYPGKSAAIDIGGDYTFWAPSVELMSAHCEYAPTFAYRYDFAPRVLKWLGLHATHGSELFAVFGVYRTFFGRLVTLFGGRAGAGAVTEEVQSQWLRFARTGTPNDTWPAYDTTSRSTRIIDARSRVENDPLRERREAWAGFRGYDAVELTKTESKEAV